MQAGYSITRIEVFSGKEVGYVIMDNMHYTNSVIILNWCHDDDFTRPINEDTVAIFKVKWK